MQVTLTEKNQTPLYTGSRTAVSSPLSSPANFEIQSTLKHLAIIMDGNRRWAKERTRPAKDGHTQGMQVAIDLLPVLADTNIEVVTLFAFAQANWTRETSEVDHLMQLARIALRRFTRHCIEHGVRVEVIGSRHELPTDLVRAIERAEEATYSGCRQLRIALNYSSRAAILKAAQASAPTTSPAEFERQLCGDAPPVDLLVRTGFEQRLSDFLLWECAFAELYFAPCHWPDFNAAQLHRALSWYQLRERRYGI